MVENPKPMKKRLYIFALLVAAVFVACQPTLVTPDDEDQTAAELEQSQRLNFLRWPILNEKVHQNPQALGSYSAEVETVRKYLRSRVPFLDSKIK